MGFLVRSINGKCQGKKPLGNFSGPVLRKGGMEVLLPGSFVSEELGL